MSKKAKTTYHDEARKALGFPKYRLHARSTKTAIGHMHDEVRIRDVEEHAVRQARRAKGSPVRLVKSTRELPETFRDEQLRIWREETERFLAVGV